MFLHFNSNYKSSVSLLGLLTKKKKKKNYYKEEKNYIHQREFLFILFSSMISIINDVHPKNGIVPSETPLSNTWMMFNQEFKILNHLNLENLILARGCTHSYPSLLGSRDSTCSLVRSFMFSIITSISTPMVWDDEASDDIEI